MLHDMLTASTNKYMHEYSHANMPAYTREHRCKLRELTIHSSMHTKKCMPGLGPRTSANTPGQTPKAYKKFPYCHCSALSDDCKPRLQVSKNKSSRDRRHRIWKTLLTQSAVLTGRAGGGDPPQGVGNPPPALHRARCGVSDPCS